MAMPSSSSQQELEYLIRAGYGLISIVSSEEERVERALRSIGAARTQGRRLVHHRGVHLPRRWRELW